jgi:hypothetical protein
MVLLFATALACADCHKDLAAHYARSPMANSTGRVVAAEEMPGGVGDQYVITPQMGLQWSGGSVALTFFIGSRRMGRSYAFSQSGHLYQVPVGYYATRKAWDLAPGYEHDVEPDLTRPITAECLFCHASRAQVVVGTINRYAAIVHGIGCERCHGDPASHDALVRPGKLPARRRDSVCEQCHLSGAVRLVRAGKRLTDFRPGQDLGDFLEVFVGGARRAGVRVNGHAEALAESRCKQAAGDRLWCGTCHNPHRTTNYDAVCQSCHARAHAPRDCSDCHMAKARASDGGHTVFTDHAIGGRREAKALGSYFRRGPATRDLGLAYVELAAKDKDTALIEKAWPLLRQAASTGSHDPPLLNAIAGLLAADGDRERAAEYFRLSLRQDPVQPDVLRRLAGLLGTSPEARTLRQRADRMHPLPR